MMGAPISSSRSRMGVWPPRAAKWRAVAPSLSRAVRPMSVKVTWRKGGEGPGEAAWGGPLLGGGHQEEDMELWEVTLGAGAPLPRKSGDRAGSSHSACHHPRAWHLQNSVLG